MKRILFLFILIFVSCKTTNQSTNDVSPEQTNGDQLWLKIGEKKVLEPDGLEVSFRQLLEDSRCPKDVVCVWEGRAEIQLWLIKEGPDSIFVNVSIPQYPRSPIDVLGYRITLLQLDPYPRTDITYQPSDYKALLDVLKLN